ncbi:hypothetical protein Hanom_Chr01g00050621 [Helianthus anomalus]
MWARWPRCGSIGGHVADDWTALEEVDEVARARGFIGYDTPWDRYTICYCVFFVLYTKWILTTLCDRLFDLEHLSSFRVMVCEFLASFEFTPRPTDQPEEFDDPEEPWIEVSFRLVGVWHEMSLRVCRALRPLHGGGDRHPRLHRGHPYGPMFDSLQVLAGDW